MESNIIWNYCSIYNRRTLFWLKQYPVNKNSESGYYFDMTFQINRLFLKTMVMQKDVGL